VYREEGFERSIVGQSVGNMMIEKQFFGIIVKRGSEQGKRNNDILLGKMRG
jgi:hypothetical protein